MSAPKKVSLSVEMKEIIHKYEEGARIIDIACELGKASSTITTIVKKEEIIKGVDVSKGVTLIASKKKHPEILNEVKKLLLEWIKEKQLSGDSISNNAICEKAKALHEELLRRTPSASAEEECALKASRGCCYKFKKRLALTL